MKKIRGEFLVILAAVLWGTTGTAQALAPTGADPRSVGAVRLAIGGLTLLIFALLRGFSFRSMRWPLLPIIFGGLSMAAYNLFFFAGVARAGVAVGTIVTIGSAPILAGLLGWLFLKERPTPRWAAATGLAILGGIMLVLPGASLSMDYGGILLALISGLAYAIFSIASKGMLKDAPPDVAMAIVFTLGGLILSPILFTTDLSWLGQSSGWLSALFLGLISTALAYILFARGLQFIPVARAVTLTLAEPLTASTLGILLLGERLTWAASLGVALIFFALVTLSTEKN
jgi:drug/metabolite transporter, DME family